MNHTVALILSALFVSIGLLAELNLIRIFVGDWREDRRQRARRRLRQAADSQSQVASLARGCWTGRPHEPAALRRGMMPTAAFSKCAPDARSNRTQHAGGWIPDLLGFKTVVQESGEPPAPSSHREQSPALAPWRTPRFSSATPTLHSRPLPPRETTWPSVAASIAASIAAACIRLARCQMRLHLRPNNFTASKRNLHRRMGGLFGWAQ